ncbi:MAG: pyruvate kinase [Methylacidiphilales bacterium]|nr:pyruvate kinase [Candidatus Methylacidiphilales bacterium]MDW8348807.1 pyruvate kinase [Verrucomicrobiae bacterium]
MLSHPLPSHRKTKIIATLGPRSSDDATLEALIKAGVNILRLNMSHADHQWVRSITHRARSIAEQLQYPLGFLLDTQGPAIRTGDLPTQLNLKPGDIFTFTVRGEKNEEQFSVDTNYDQLIDDICVGDIVMVDNGMIQMRVLAKENKKLRCEVLTPGTLGSRRHINLPGIKVNLPALTDKDLKDIALGVEVGVDYVALSFAREANDIFLLRQILDTHHSSALVIAKIEDQSAITNIDEIIDAADGVMVARGDLGIEIPFEELPIVQRRIVKNCIRKQKPVIVATHMLESMIQNPIPTRAEITDVANAVYEQADALMLSGETAVGQYPVECIRVLDRVARRIERSGGAGYARLIQLQHDKERVIASAVHLADETQAEALCVFTRTGFMARTAASLRPRHSPIFAFTPDVALARKLLLHYGIVPIVLEFSSDPEVTLNAALQLLHERYPHLSGKPIVVVSNHKAGREAPPMVQLLRGNS